MAFLLPLFFGKSQQSEYFSCFKRSANVCEGRLSGDEKIKVTLKGNDIILIGITTNAFEEDRSLSLTTGCDNFIGKPFRENVLFEKIAKHLGACYICDKQNPSTQELTSVNLFT